MEISWIRVYLLCGLVLHKAVWEFMKGGRSSAAQKIIRPFKARLLAIVKLGILFGIIVQTLIPPVFPIASDPSALLTVGVALYTLGLAVAVAGRVQLGKNWSDIEKSHLQKGHQLVSRGLYRHVRHPIYTGDLILLAGLELALNSWLVLGVAAVAVYVRQRAIHEERGLQQAIPEYAQYCRRTSRFLPFLPV